METSRLKRSLFGYSRKGVRALLTEREALIVKASREARKAEAKSHEVATEIDQARTEIGELRTRIRDLESQLANSAERFRAVERSSSPSTSEGLTDVLQAAERALARLTEAARRDAEQELGETERERDDLRVEIDRLTAWRARMEPLSESVPRSIEDVRREASALAGRLRETLDPMIDAMDVLAARISELSDTPPAPLETPVPDSAAVIRLEDAGEVPEAPRPIADAWVVPRRASGNAG